MAAAEQGLKSILLGTETLADQGTAAERNVYPRRVEQALGIVYRCLGDYDYLIEAFAEADYQESNARDAWAALLEKVREMDAGGVDNLKEQLWSFDYVVGTPMTDHIQQMKDVVERLRAVSGNVEPSDSDFAAALLKSVANIDSYRPLRKVLKLKRNVSSTEVANELEVQAREDDIYDRKMSVESNFVRTKTHTSNVRQSDVQSKRVCYICQEKGHVARHCEVFAEAKLLMKQRRSGQNTALGLAQANMVEDLQDVKSEHGSPRSERSMSQFFSDDEDF